MNASIDEIELASIFTRLLILERHVQLKHQCNGWLILYWFYICFTYIFYYICISLWGFFLLVHVIMCLKRLRNVRKISAYKFNIFFPLTLDDGWLSGWFYFSNLFGSEVEKLASMEKLTVKLDIWAFTEQHRHGYAFLLPATKAVVLRTSFTGFSFFTSALLCVSCLAAKSCISCIVYYCIYYYK